MNDDLVAFLNARLDEDEAAAKAALDPNPLEAPDGVGGTWHPDRDGCCVLDADNACLVERGITDAVTAHIALHDPARVLRDVDAGRAIVADHLACEEWNESARKNRGGKREICITLRALASVYSDHPDYRQEWKP